MNMFAGNSRSCMIYRSWTANSFQRFVDRLRIVFQIAERRIRRIAEAVVPFPVFRLRLHGIDGEQVGMRELQTIVVHAWLACDDEQRSRVQFALHPVNIRFAIRKEDQRRQRFWGVATRCEIVVRDCCDQAEASTCHGKNARFEHMRGERHFLPDFRFMQ